MDGKNRKNKLLNIFLSISPLLLLVLVMYAVLILSATIGLVLAIRQGAGSLEDAVNAAVSFASAHIGYAMILYAIASILILLIWDKKVFGKGIIELTPGFSVRNIAGIAVIAVAANYVSLGILGLYETFIPDAFGDYIELIDSSGLGSDLLVSVVYGVILAPIAEELAFRAISLKYLIRGGLPCLIAATVQALLFGILHMNLVQSTYTFVLGLVLGAVMLKTGKLFYTVLAHITFNIWGIFADRVFPLADRLSPFLLVAIFVPVILLALRYLMEDKGAPAL